MLRSAALLVLFCSVFPVALLTGPRSPQAGAWLEQTQRGFISSSLRLRPSGQELSAYAAYGVTPTLTFGLDLNQSDSGGFQSAHALAFARLPLRQRDTGWQWAMELAAGQRRHSSSWSGVTRVTLSAGRGWQLAGRSGWIAVDLAREWGGPDATQAWKLDSTLGFNARSGPAPILQIELYQPRDAALVSKLLPGLRWSLRNERELLTGVEWRSFGDTRLGLRLELWHRF